jgi:hypothetical protein
MFSMLRLRPPHGWNAVAWELAIVVVGVLIALAAQQLVEDWQWQEQVSETRQSLNSELAEARANAIEQTIEHDCIERRLDVLGRLTESRSRLPKLQVQLFELRPWNTATWQSATASGAVAHMPISERNRYAALFGVIASLGSLHRDAFDTSADVATMSRHEQLTDISRDRLQADIARLRKFNELLFIGSAEFVDRTKRLKLAMFPSDQAMLDHDRRTFGHCAMPEAPAAVAR